MQIRTLLLAALLVAATGCRNQVRYELLERDLRFHEDEIYHLEDELAAMQGRLEATRRENAALRRELAEREGGGSSSGLNPLEPAAPPAVELGTESTGPAPLGEQAPPYSGPPVIDPLPPEENGAPLEEQPFPADPSEPPPAFVPPSGSGAGLSLPRIFSPQPEVVSDYHVEQITLSKLLTGGHNTDGRLGDEGLLVVLEPRNSAGQVINVPGELSLVLLDPELSGEAARVARWDYQADEVADRFRQNVMGSGIRLELAWPGDPPAHGDLKLFARFTTAEGQRFEAEKAIQVELAGQPGRQWQSVVADQGPRLTGGVDEPPQPTPAEPWPVLTPEAPPTERKAHAARQPRRLPQRRPPAGR